MTARLEIRDFVHGARPVYDALTVMSKSAVEAGLAKDLLELVKTRASQINGCAYCVQFHVNLAREAGVAQAKLDQLAVWRESPLFSPRERAALGWTEALTVIGPESAGDALFADVKAQFPDAQWPALTTAIAHINLWNRLGVAMRFTPPPSS